MSGPVTRPAGVPPAPLRCGRTGEPSMHLVEADDTLTQRSWWSTRAKVALCGVELDEATEVPDFDGDCPGCRDCSRYCTHCVRVATRHSADECATSGAAGPA